MIGDPICCTHPRLIVRKDASQLLTYYRRYSMNGHVYDFRNQSGPLYFPIIKEIFRYGKEYSQSHNWRDICNKHRELHNKYFLISDCGESIPVIMLVPCGHCELCLNRKTLDFCTRCDIETAMSSNSAFITLTYDNEHRPVGHSLYKDVAQRWIKRCRKYLCDRGFDGNKFKYFICGEYGSKTGREHYHAIIWNLPDDYMATFSENWKAYKNLVNNTWCNKYRLYGPDGKPLRNENGGYCFGIDSYGFSYISGTAPESIRYCAKYMCKESPRSDGKQPPFRLYSYKPTIGYDFADQWRDWYREHPYETQITYLSCDGKNKTVPIPKYFKDKWFPSKSKILPYNIYEAYKKYENASFLCECDRQLIVAQLEATCPDDDPIYPELYNLYQRLLSELSESLVDDVVPPDWYIRYWKNMMYSGDLPWVVNAHFDSLVYNWSIIQDVDFSMYDRLLAISRDRSEWIRCVPRETQLDPDVLLSKVRADKAIRQDREIF